MIRLLFLMPFAAALFLGACRSDPAGDWPAPSPALWEVRDGDGQMKGWLFGTVHALPDGVDWHTRQIDNAVEQAGLLLVEVANLDDGKAANASFMQFARTNGLPPLTERVTKQDRPALRGLMDKTGLDDSDFTEYESWAAALMLANAAQADQAAGNGADRWLLEQDIPTGELEGFNQQFRIFDQLSPEDQTDLLMGVVAEAQDSGGSSNLRAWLTGDIDALQANTRKGILADPDLRRILLTDRNRRWAKIIATKLDQAKDGPVFVAVGAAHMLGEDGLPSLLRRRGFRVNRVQ
ncbi:TraB/GumN family protein [Altericroceibacterium spongiae]|uniref:TraB/GumN family protein n=1 Tax=Altericroceibacterium spongiae TaxID=2320269 RepID=A0A420ESA1_9SPHN|nr:TraB/GumN family protein [Altericroceibacterium spongiae]RKF23510.1 TraB/GumN family protein [Altericroceibacterium spongiae]